MKTINPGIQNLLKYGARKPNPTYWCKKCNIPLIQEKCENCRNLGIVVSKSFLRPVFKEDLLEDYKYAFKSLKSENEENMK
ncbi:MAG: hypothetical protein HW390_2676 [Candidatus Brocadiaceae bacterium]|nr:hypothetical protein [Candidatus Brocadiaceae bacterium]